MQAETARKLSDIFSAAGQAFSQMAELTMQLHPNNEAQPLGGKWTEKEVDMLKGAVERFGSDLDKIGSVIKNRTQDQMKKQVSKDQKSPTPAKGTENAVPALQPEEKKPRLPAPTSAAAASGPVIRTVAPTSGIAPPLVLAVKPPQKEQKARRGGGANSSPVATAVKRPGPASRTMGVNAATSSKLPAGGPKLATMLESGKRPVAVGASSDLSEYKRMKLLREVEDDYSDDDSESDSDDADLNESTDDDDDDDE